MSKDQTNDLLIFLEPFSDEIKELALWLREFVWDLYPSANELIYNNYNALAVGWSPTDKVGHTFCSIAASLLRICTTSIQNCWCGIAFHT